LWQTLETHTPVATSLSHTVPLSFSLYIYLYFSYYLLPRSGSWPSNRAMFAWPSVRAQLAAATATALFQLQL